MATVNKVVLKKGDSTATVYTTDKVDELIGSITGGSGNSLASLKSSIDAHQRNLEQHNQDIIDLKKNLGTLTTTVGGKMTKSDYVGDDNKILASVLPSYVDDVLEYANLASFPKTGEAGKIYVALDSNKTYRWGGTSYVIISDTLAIGETSGTAYAGNKGKANADAIEALKTGKADKSSIPTKVSQLDNDSDFASKSYVSDFKVTKLYSSLLIGAASNYYTYETIQSAFVSKNNTITASTSDDTITFDFQ